jgi:hypothetical protein
VPGLNCHSSAGWICGWSRIVIWDFGDAIRWTIIWWYGGLCLRNLVTSDNWRHFEAVRTWTGPTFLEQFFLWTWTEHPAVDVQIASSIWRDCIKMHYTPWAHYLPWPWTFLFAYRVFSKLGYPPQYIPIKNCHGIPLDPNYITITFKLQLHHQVLFCWLHICWVPIVSSLFSIT